MGYIEFKNRVCMYYKKLGMRDNEIVALKAAIDKLYNQVLPSRDNEKYYITRDFTNTENLYISFEDGRLKCYYSERMKRLMVTLKCPQWRDAYKYASKKKYITDILDNIMHFMFQYMYRAYQINLIGAIVLATGRCTDFRGQRMSTSGDASIVELLETFERKATELGKENNVIQGYYRIINALDPYVNRVIFYYVHALDLNDKGYAEEAITALDNMVDTIFQDIRRRYKFSKQKREDLQDDVYEILKFYDSEGRTGIEKLYLIRCGFSAHPAQSKWWDFAEIYGEAITNFFSYARKFLVCYLKYENSHRVVENNPDRWSEWLKKYSDIVFDAVWFHKIPL